MFNEELRRQQVLEQQRINQYEQANRMISDTEKNRNYKTEESLLQEEKRALQRKIIWLPISIFLFFISIGCAFLSIGICSITKLILKDLIWLGIIFLILGIAIFICGYFIFKKLLINRKIKYAFPVNEKESSDEDFSFK